MKNRINRILIYAILLWLVSAAYSSYISSSAPGSNYLAGDDQNILSLVWDRFTPGKIKIKARAAIAVDDSSGDVIFAKNQDLRLSVASLTKLATVLVFLETNPDLSNTVTIIKKDYIGSGRSKLKVGETITLKDCLHLCLMCSDNVAARALARYTGYTISEFVKMMNEQAMKLGMQNTIFVDPTGLDARNVSTANDFVKLVQRVCKNDLAARISSKKFYQFTSLNKKITHTLYNTNRLLYSQWDIDLGKTGHISRAGYCLALHVSDSRGRQVSAVVLGSPSNQYRYRDAYRLLTMAMEN